MTGELKSLPQCSDLQKQQKFWAGGDGRNRMSSLIPDIVASSDKLNGGRHLNVEVVR